MHVTFDMEQRNRAVNRMCIAREYQHIWWVACLCESCVKRWAVVANCPARNHEQVEHAAPRVCECA